MAIKLTKKERMARAAVAAVPAMLFAGSAMATVATATGLAVPFAGLYVAAGIAAALCALGAASGVGAALAALLSAAAALIYGVTHAAGLAALRALIAAWGGEAGDPAQIALGARALTTGGAFALAALFFALLNRREFVSTAITILLAVLVACHALSAEAELAAKVDEVKRAAVRYDNVSFAIGACFETDSADAQRALQVADTRMYEDKRAYYEKNPEKRRPDPKDEHKR